MNEIRSEIKERNIKIQLNMETKVQGQDVSPNDAKRVSPAVPSRKSTRMELLETYLEPTDLTVKELIDRNAFAQIMQFAEAYKLEQLLHGQCMCIEDKDGKGFGEEN